MKNVSEKSKSFLIGLCLGSLLVGAIFAGWQRCSGRRTLVKFTSVRAKEISESIKVCLVFGDRKDAAAILESLKHRRSIVFGGVYDKEDKLFASYYRRDIKPESIKLTKYPKVGYSFSDGYLKVSEPVFFKGEVLGTVCIWTEL